jgi:hypothetical protein
VNRFGHHAVAASIALGVAQGVNLVAASRGTPGIPPESALAAAVLAQPFSAGRLSPDADQTWLRRFGHRRGVHGWWWPALAATVLALSPLAGAYALWGPIIGWGSHLFPADWCFGKAGRSIPRGIPMAPFSTARTGLGFRVSRRPKPWDRRKGKRGHSAEELAASWVVAALVLWQGWATLGAMAW